MKTSILVILSFVFGYSYSQNSVLIENDPAEQHSQIFSLSPMSKKVDKVNGLVFGVGHVEKTPENAT